MRVVGDEAELQSAIQAAMNEARSSFGDDRVFIEKFVQQPRHIEIQILADTHGNIIFLGERECSIQRRHQKVIEEAPSCLLSQKTRQAMGQQAIALARAVNYRSAGTVEFIVGADEDFYFLEMNTRLQVEHPVTELVHDVDLVSLMIKIAAGERLELTQEEVKAHGWAVEARIYAEDSTRGFLPSIGQLRRYVEPEIEAIRIDSGVVEGSHIAMFYDPMIAKIIAYGKDRQTAISELSHALDRYQINGVETNIQFLNAILSDKDFIAGDITTAFIDEKFDGKFVPLEPVGEMRTLLIALAAGIMPQFVKQKNSQQQGKSSYLLLVKDEEDYLFDWQMVEGDAVVTIDEAQYTISGSVHKSMSIFTGSIVSGDMSGRQLAVKIERDYHHLRLTTASYQLRARLLPAIAQNVIEYMPEQSALTGLLKVSAPMPGLLTKLLVSEGDTLFSGQEVAIMEAMKMENSLRCEIDCVVGVIHASEGDLLNVDDLIITLKEK
jgi:propionyl-CoA carboxylase alpha chain